MSDCYFHLTMIGIASGLAALSLYGLHATHVVVNLWQLVPTAMLSAALLSLAAYYRWRGVDKFVNLLLITVWAVVLSKLHLLPMFVAARMPVPPSDALLARCDRALGVEVVDVVRVVRHYPMLDQFLGVCYDLLIPLLTLAILVPPLCGRMRMSKEYTLAGAVAAMISMPCFAMFQARGPWEYYGYEPLIKQENYVRTFDALKTEPTFHLDLEYRDGLMCFPSFHTILAVLPAVALWPIPYVRWFAVTLATLIVVSTVTTGTHYIIDVWAGLIVTVISVLAAKGFSRLEARWLASQSSAMLVKSGQE